MAVNHREPSDRGQSFDEILAEKCQATELVGRCGFERAENAMRSQHAPGTNDQRIHPDEDFEEVLLVLPIRQLVALEQEALSRRLTTGGMLRRLIQGFLSEVNAIAPFEPERTSYDPA